MNTNKRDISQDLQLRQWRDASTQRELGLVYEGKGLPKKETELIGTLRYMMLLLADGLGYLAYWNQFEVRLKDEYKSPIEVGLKDQSGSSASWNYDQQNEVATHRLNLSAWVMSLLRFNSAMDHDKDSLTRQLTKDWLATEPGLERRYRKMRNLRNWNFAHRGNQDKDKTIAGIDIVPVHFSDREDINAVAWRNKQWGHSLNPRPTQDQIDELCDLTFNALEWTGKQYDKEKDRLEKLAIKRFGKPDQQNSDWLKFAGASDVDGRIDMIDLDGNTPTRDF